MKQLQVLTAFLLLVSLIGCGGGKSSSNNVTVTVTPTTATVYTAQNQQFTATVTGGSSSAVTWEVNGIIGGSATTVGTINAAGLYTAPTTVPNPASVTVSAVSVADTTKSATATVTIQLGANLSISPSSLTLNTGAQQQFTVSSNGNAPTNPVTFSVSCKSSAPGACGSITANGLYTAPLSPPPGGGNVIVTATETAGSASFSTSATVTIQASVQTLGGQYAFTLSGTANGASYHAAGSVSFDGNGNITGGSEDVNSQGTVSTLSITGGTYTFSTDQRVTANVQTSAGNVTWYVALANPTQGNIEYAGSGISASGRVYRQDPTAFALASVTGNYTFQLSGIDTGVTKQLAEAGSLAADGSGNIGSGLLDANTGGTLSSNQTLSGTVTTPASTTGRGTLSITSGVGTQSFVYYLVDATRFELVEIDTTRATSGEAVQQTGGPYDTASLHGNLAVALNGTSSTGLFGVAGILPFGGGAILGGSIDRNDAGTFVGSQAITGGSYSVTDATTGRTQVSITLSSSSISLILYPQSTSSFNVVETSTSEVATGAAFVATVGAISNGTLQGNYVVGMSGEVGTTPEDVIGVLNANGGGVFTGTLDISNGGANTPLLSSPYSVSTSGSTTTLRSGFANFSSVGFNLYFIDSTHVLLLENDSKGVLTGMMQIQQ